MMSLPLLLFSHYNSLVPATPLTENSPMSDQIHPIRLDRLRGMTYTAIAEKYGIDQRTAKRYAEQNLPLSELEHRPFFSILDEYEPVIRLMLRDGPVFARTVYARLRELGYTGGYTIVNRRVQQIISENDSLGLYPADARRTRNIPPALTLAQRIQEEKQHADERTR